VEPSTTRGAIRGHRRSRIRVSSACALFRIT
jgi:hypothetical protein